MLPIGGSFEFFQMQLSNKKNLSEGHTIGLMFVDPAQPSVEAYITNYLTPFNKASGKYLDFYLPGYAKTKNPGPNSIHITPNYWDFDRDCYNKFQYEMNERYGTPYSTTAYLLLIEMGPNKEFREIIKIELDKGKHDPKDIGDFLFSLFEFSKTEIEFEAIQKWLVSNKMKKFFTSTFLNLIKTKLGFNAEDLL